MDLNFDNLILASASPRRFELLKMLNLSFRVIPANIDESLAPNDPIKHVLYNSYNKSLKVFKEHNGLVIGVDTIVYLNDTILGKPSDEKDAFEKLKQLSGNTHIVYSGVSVISNDFEKNEYSETEVTFNNLSDDEIKWYINTKEPMDKAGAYGIQGYGAIFIKQIKGCYFNVMGLPLSLLYSILKEFKEIEK